MIQQLGAGRVLNGILDECKCDLTPKSLDVKWPQINALLGLNLNPRTDAGYTRITGI